MKTTRKPISFIATSNPDEAKDFYGKVLGLKLIESSPFAVVFDDGEHMLRIQIVPDHAPAPYTAYGWQVQDIEQDIRELSHKGVTFQTFDQLDQSASGVWTTPDGHKIAWFKDPSGNTLSLTQIG